MIPTWRNINSAAPELSQRALETSGDQMQQALSGLQKMAAEQRGFNVKAEEAATAENLLKFQQAARNMSLGELDALGKADPNQLMDKFGLNQKNIGQAVAFANQQDDTVRAEELEMYQYRENQRKQQEAPIRAVGSTLLAEGEATGDFSKFNAFLKSEAPKLQDASDLYAGLNDAKNRLLQKERSDISFNQSQQDRNRMLSKIKAEEGFNALATESLTAVAASSDPDIRQKATTQVLDYIRKNPTVPVGTAIQTLDTINQAAEKFVAPNSEQAAQIEATKFSSEVRLKAKQAETQQKLAQAQRDFPVDARIVPIMEAANSGVTAETALSQFIKDKIPNNTNFSTDSDVGGEDVKKRLPAIQEAYRKAYNQELPGPLLSVALESIPLSGSWIVGDAGIDTEKLTNKVIELGGLYQKGQANFSKLAGLELQYQDEMSAIQLEEASRLAEVMSGKRKENKEFLMQMQRLKGNQEWSKLPPKTGIK